MAVNWDDEIPKMWKKHETSTMFQTNQQIIPALRLCRLTFCGVARGSPRGEPWMGQIYHD